MKNSKVTIVDYGLGNLLSLKRAFEFVGADVLVTSENNLIANSSRIVLPGVGAFNKAMELIKGLGIEEILTSSAKKEVPFLGICLGMQLLFTESEEFELTRGLNLIPGKVVSIPKSSKGGKKLILPHIGWNSLELSKNRNNWKDTILDKNDFSDKVYFIHSFMAIPDNTSDKVANCTYGDHEITAVVENKNIVGCQFHPEKSGKLGLKILKNFLEK